MNLPIGIQTFSELRTKGYVYIDKTDFVYDLANGAAKYVFLSRPRRFGKSLLVSTFESYFNGERKLFEGLKLYDREKEWIQYPVIYFDLSMAKHMREEQLVNYLHYILDENCKKFCLECTREDVNIRVAKLISQSSEKTQRQSVVLIDEYDAPLLDVVADDGALDTLRQIMRNFFSPLKGMDRHLRFVFLTGITKFSQLSIFSELNNLNNISMLPEYGAICGITEQELTTTLAEAIDDLASYTSSTPDEVFAQLKQLYDGYHFTWPSPDIYNPYSLIKALGNKKLDAWWFDSGTPTFLIEQFRRFNVTLDEIKPADFSADEFDAPTDALTDITPLLYQSGYLTIKGYDPLRDAYHLYLPNDEVQNGLSKTLLKNYISNTKRARDLAREISVLIGQDKLEEALELIRDVLSSLPYAENVKSEGHYQQLLYLIFFLSGCDRLDAETRTSQGRIDLTFVTNNFRYIFELKTSESSAAAIQQIDDRGYASRFAISNLPIKKVGLSIDLAQRTLAPWTIEDA